jgi:hypothetical protein
VSDETLLPLASDARKQRPGGYYQGIRVDVPCFGADYFIVRFSAEQNLLDATLSEFRAKHFGVFAKRASERAALYAFETGIIFHLGGRIYHSPVQPRFEKQRIQPSSAGIYGSRQTSRASAYYHELSVLHNITSIYGNVIWIILTSYAAFRQIIYLAILL